MCYDMGRLTLAEAKLASLEINLLNFDQDHIQISRTLNELVPAYPLETLYQKIPISQRKIDKLLELITYDWETPTAEELKRKQRREAKKIASMKEVPKGSETSNGPYIKTYAPITGTIGEPREIFTYAIKFGGIGKIIIIHSHPSGNLTPSDADKIFTKQIMDAGKLLRIEVIDHLIISVKSYYSFSNIN